MTPLTLSIILLTVFAATSTLQANHIHSGKMVEAGTFESPEGPRKYAAVSDLKMPIICWDELATAGLVISDCTETSITFRGDIDQDDFVKGVTLTFPRDEYISFGCPLPPQTDFLSKRDEIIFRYITSAHVQDDITIVKTDFISGAKVAPKVMLHIGGLVPSTERQLQQVRRSDGEGELLLDAISRVDTLGIQDAKRETKFNITDGFEIDVVGVFSGGLCEFVFTRDPAEVSWIQRIAATVEVTATITQEFSTKMSGELIKEGVPGLGFSKSFGTLGKVTIGMALAIDYEVDASISSEVVASFTAAIDVGKNVRIGTQDSSFETIEQETELGAGIAGSIQTSLTLDAVNVTAQGFVGVRPVVALEVAFPIIGEGGVEFGGTVGLQATIGFQNPPYPRTEEGAVQLGGAACDSCHEIEGGIDLQGRRLSVTGLIPILDDKEFVIEDRFFSTRLGTFCAFEISCPEDIDIAPDACPLDESPA